MPVRPTDQSKSTETTYGHWRVQRACTRAARDRRRGRDHAVYVSHCVTSSYAVYCPRAHVCVCVCFVWLLTVDLDHLHALRQHFQLAVSPQHDHDDPEPQSISEAPVDASRRHHSVLMLPRRQEPNLSHAAFAAALESADCFFASDRAIFDRIFTLLDRTGGDEILAAEFLVGVCALLSGDLATKLQGASSRGLFSLRCEEGFAALLE